MEDNLEIYFCEICSESIPANELAAKNALVVKGKVVGSCCLPQFQPTRAKVVSGTSPLGLTAMTGIVLAGVAAATLFLETRLTEDVGSVREDLRQVRGSVTSQGDMWARLETRLDKTLQQDALSPVETRVGDLATSITEVDKQLSLRFEGLGQRFGQFENQYQRLEAGQGSVRSDIKDVQIEVVRLGRELAAAAAAPRGLPVASGGIPGPKVHSKPADAASDEEPDLALPAPLAAQVTRLKDEDAGNRFEAVDHLVQSKNPATLPYLVPMLKDGDPFVRRLTAEGLSRFKQASSVDALLVTLADPESIVRHTAHASLKKLTSQDIAFDPDGSARARSSAQRRWKDWWVKNRGKF